ncbi:transthyretin-like family protein [Calycomorphotria hydatis]|uniref:Nickel uptake substrate-specific transmembrane region n=1 Tax=Calycomorphotria hydatis TaxID=2528027 RepID=A0A517TFD6_9PLAN|nr:carboxypeptidase-like regulatory domain-containing protein [Calycomorphotria hydatis]QDT67091.1 hypothetical protein V22_43640 [Calycomorphotria hydatis]
MCRIQHTFAALFILLIAVASTGCGQTDDTPALGVVKGKVTLDGKPLDGARVLFQPQAGRPSEAITNEHGDYTLLYLSNHKGALIGQHKVHITTEREGFSDEANDGKTIKGRKEILPAKYHSKSTLTTDVTEGSNTVDFELESGN